MYGNLRWIESLRLHESNIAQEFHRAKSYGEQRQLAERMSYEKDRNQSPAILQNLYTGEKVHKTYEQLLEEYNDKLEKLRNKYGTSNLSIANISPFTLNAFQDEEDDENDKYSINTLFSSASYRYSKRITNAYDKAKLRRLRTPPYKPYLNHQLWSVKAISLEKQLNQFALPNDFCVEKLANTLDKLPVGLLSGFVDTFWPAYDEDIDKRGMIGRVSIFTESMLRFDPALNKEKYRELELDALVLTLANDFLHLQKQLRYTFHHTSRTFLPPRPSDQREGDCRIEALLIAQGSDKTMHIRPLCTSGDLSLAMFELLGQKIFTSGVIQMPQLLPVQYERHVDGFYRFHFTMPYANSTWQYIKYRYPNALRDAGIFLTGIFCPVKDEGGKGKGVNSQYFVVEELVDESIPSRLQQAAFQISQGLTKVWNAEEVIQSATIDFEACRDYEEVRRREFVLAPHLVNDQDSERYVYRIRNILNIVTQKRIAIGRRNAITTLDGNSMRSLKDFYLYYHYELAILTGKIGRPADDPNMTDMQIYARNRARQHYSQVMDHDSDGNSSDEESQNKFNFVNFNVSLHRSVSFDPYMAMELAKALQDNQKTIAATASTTSATSDTASQSPSFLQNIEEKSDTANLDQEEASTSKQRGRHEDSSLLLQKHHKRVQKGLRQTTKKNKILHDHTDNSLDRGSSAQSSSSSIASAQSSATARGASRARLMSGAGLRERKKFGQIVESSYEELMEKATKDYLERMEVAEQKTYSLCDHNLALPYFQSSEASHKLLHMRHKDLASPSDHKTNETSDGNPPDLMHQIIVESQAVDTSLAIPEAYFRDEKLEKRLKNLAYSTDVDKFFGKLDVKSSLQRSEVDKNEDDVKESSNKLSGRSRKYYLEHQEEHATAYEKLLKGMNPRILNRLREYDHQQRIKEYVKKRRMVQEVTMKQVQDLHIIHHFQKHHDFSDSEDEGDGKGDEKLNDLLGDYADECNLQNMITERAAEEAIFKKRKPTLRPRTSQVSPELYSRLSARVSMHRNSISEGRGRRESLASIRKARNTMYITLNNVLLDGKVIKEVVRIKEEEESDVGSLQWETMTDSLSTVLSLGHINAEAMVEVLPQVLEEESPVNRKDLNSPGGRFWTPSKDSVIERHLLAEQASTPVNYEEEEWKKSQTGTSEYKLEASKCTIEGTNSICKFDDEDQLFTSTLKEHDEDLTITEPLSMELGTIEHVKPTEKIMPIEQTRLIEQIKPMEEVKSIEQIKPTDQVRHTKSRERRYAKIDVTTSRPAMVDGSPMPPIKPPSPTINTQDVVQSSNILPVEDASKTPILDDIQQIETLPGGNRVAISYPVEEGQDNNFANEEEKQPAGEELFSLLQEVRLSREGRDPLLGLSESEKKLNQRVTIRNIDLPFLQKPRTKYIHTNNQHYNKPKNTAKQRGFTQAESEATRVRLGVKGLGYDMNILSSNKQGDNDDRNDQASKSHSMSDLPTISPHKPQSSNPKSYYYHHIDPSTYSLLVSPITTNYKGKYKHLPLLSSAQDFLDQSQAVQLGDHTASLGITHQSLGADSISAYIPQLDFAPRDLSLQSDQLNQWLNAMKQLVMNGEMSFSIASEHPVSEEKREEISISSAEDTVKSSAKNMRNYPESASVQEKFDSEVIPIHVQTSISLESSTTANECTLNLQDRAKEEPGRIEKYSRVKSLQSPSLPLAKKSPRLLQSPNRKNRIVRKQVSPPPRAVQISDQPPTLVVDGVDGLVYYSSDEGDSVFNPFHETDMERAELELVPQITSPSNVLARSMEVKIKKKLSSTVQASANSKIRKSSKAYFSDEVSDDKEPSTGFRLGRLGGSQFILPQLSSEKE